MGDLVFNGGKTFPLGLYAFPHLFSRQIRYLGRKPTVCPKYLGRAFCANTRPDSRCGMSRSTTLRRASSAPGTGVSLIPLYAEGLVTDGFMQDGLIRV